MATFISLFVPFTTLGLVLMQPISIVIPEFGVFCDPAIVTISFIFFSYIYLFISKEFSFYKKKKTHLIESIIYNSVPSHIFLMLIYAEWHPYITVGIACLYFLLVLFCFWKLFIRKSNNEHHLFSAKRKKRLIILFSMYAFWILTLIPCCFSVFIYDMKAPEYRPAETPCIENKSDNMAAATATDIYMDHMKLFSNLEETNWNSLNVTERITVLKNISDFEADRLKVPRSEVRTKAVSENGTLAYFSAEENCIWIDIEYLMALPANESINSLLHEQYHALQIYLVTSIDLKNKLYDNFYFDELQKWKYECEHYADPSEAGYEVYYSQSLEVSAREFAEAETETIFWYVDRTERN